MKQISIMKNIALSVTLFFLLISFSDIAFCQVDSIGQKEQSDQAVDENREEEIAKIFKVVEEWPLFYDCPEEEGYSRKMCSDKALLEYVYSSLELKEFATDSFIPKKEKIIFLIKSDGSIQVTNYMNGKGVTNAEEVFNNMDNWTPAKVGGKSVAMEYSLMLKLEKIEK